MSAASRPYQSRNGPRPGKHSMGQCRALRLTDAGRAALREYRARLALEAIEAGDGSAWVLCRVVSMTGPARVEWRRRLAERYDFDWKGKSQHNRNG